MAERLGSFCSTVTKVNWCKLNGHRYISFYSHAEVANRCDKCQCPEIGWVFLKCLFFLHASKASVCSCTGGNESLRWLLPPAFASLYQLLLLKLPEYNHIFFVICTVFKSCIISLFMLICLLGLFKGWSRHAANWLLTRTLGSSAWWPQKLVVSSVPHVRTTSNLLCNWAKYWIFVLPRS